MKRHLSVLSRAGTAAVLFLAIGILSAEAQAQTQTQAQSKPQPRRQTRNEYHIGADLSFLKQAEDAGIKFKENGVVRPGMQIFADHGYNWIRLRVMHTPAAWTGGGILPNDLQYTIKMAQEAKSHGMKFLLDFHYSDTWADPGKQYIPKAWEGQTHEQLVQSVYDYTLETMIALRQADVYPDMVQVGNEISNGMLWPDGKLPEWDNFADLLRAGVNGVYASCTADMPVPKIMLHIDKGGDRAFSQYWFDKVESYGIPYDVIGQSYYPWWHGTARYSISRSVSIFALPDIKKTS